MMLCIGDVFDQREAAALRSEVECLTFVHGRATAGWAARLVKDNEQADADDDQLELLRSRIAERILQNEIFQLAVRPKALSPLMISRYRPGRVPFNSMRWSPVRDQFGDQNVRWMFR